MTLVSTWQSLNHHSRTMTYRLLACLVIPCWMVLSAPVTAGLRVTVTPAQTGTQVVRGSIPLPRGMLRPEQSLSATIRGNPRSIAVRSLGTYSCDGSIRRALVTWTQEFSSLQPVEVDLASVAALASTSGDRMFTIKPIKDRVVLESHRSGTPSFAVAMIAPPIASLETEPRVEVVESNQFYDWRRLHYDDAEWPRILEVRQDLRGTIVLRLHVQSCRLDRHRAPDLGWRLEIPSVDFPSPQVECGTPPNTGRTQTQHSFQQGESCSVGLSENWIVDFPTASKMRRGEIVIVPGEKSSLMNYFRCHEDERVPMQPYTWRKADLVIRSTSAAPLTVTLESSHQIQVAGSVWNEAYEFGLPLEITGFRELSEVLAFHRKAITQSACVGDDFGNLTSFSEGSPSGGNFGMNRLNHCPAIFEDGWRADDRALVSTGTLWCENFHEQSIWWGPNGTGGTRYNNLRAQNQIPPDDDQQYMWRSLSAVDFCTKGYDSFLLAYEQTGDPRMREALDAQFQYAAASVHAIHQTRNIGDVRDFVQLYRRTGELRYLEPAIRLFSELRSRLSTGDLFSQGGEQLESDPPFIDDDDYGYKHPFTKPYIIGYALAGLPELSRIAPDEPKLLDVIKATSDFMCVSQDPVGGWRYPHPNSSSLILGQAIEHAWQVQQADRVLPFSTKRLDTIERVLRQRIQGWLKTGKIFGGMSGWEFATNRVKSTAELYTLYQKPAQRDARRDDTEGGIGFGGAPPEGLVYFADVLRHYLQFRSGLRLIEPPVPSEPLGTVLARVPNAGESTSDRSFQSPGIVDQLPVFRERAFERLTFPYSWTTGQFADFESWKKLGRAKVRECLLSVPPSVEFDPVVVAEIDRGTHWSRKVVLNLTGDSRVMALMTIPKGEGPFPAVLLMHDHGAKFDIGKEKVIEPWDQPPEKIASARDWINKYYGGRFLGDELARRGYICFATDMLNWSDRGGAGFENQQSLASNLLHLGMTHAGLIAHEDLRAAEFVASHAGVDSRRVAAMGLSVGCFRTWQVAALSDRIAAGAAICWMATTKGLMVPGNNQTKGQSAFVMTHPNLANFLDYPDVASLACPKPLLFFNGVQDGLFPAASAREAHQKMRTIWESQGAGDKLVTQMWDVPHLFNAEMQDAVFKWLDQHFHVKPPKP